MIASCVDTEIHGLNPSAEPVRRRPSRVQTQLGLGLEDGIHILRLFSRVKRLGARTADQLGKEKLLCVLKEFLQLGVDFLLAGQFDL